MKRIALALYVIFAAGCCHLPADPGEPGIRVTSEDRYTTVGRVEAGTPYMLTARGMWRDWMVCTDASGFESIGIMKPFERKRRLPTARWFALVGVITETSAMPANDQLSLVGVIDLTQYLGTSKAWVPTVGGTLHVFAKDMPSMYGNNDGFIRLQVAPRVPSQAAPSFSDSTAGAGNR
jgi:hypothetical protein